MSPDPLPATLDGLIAAELDRPVPPGVRALVEEILARHGPGVAAVLFYGSCRRDADDTGLLDLYVLTDGARAVLPPTVLLHCATMAEGRVARAKVAVMSRRQFAGRLRPGALDTTVWARFCQPATLAYARDEGVREWARQAVTEAVTTAALWAARLGPEEAAPAEYWRLLFARTFGAELRAERGDRPARIHAAAGAWFDAILAPAMARAGLRAEAAADGRLRPGLPRRARAPWALAWAARRVLGKALNLLRLVKAGFTFEGGADYLAWKIGRHSGEAIELTEWQRRNPLLAAPAMLWRLYRRGAVR
jgi:hypothetical protein